LGRARQEDAAGGPGRPDGCGAGRDPAADSRRGRRRPPVPRRIRHARRPRAQPARHCRSRPAARRAVTQRSGEPHRAGAAAPCARRVDRQRRRAARSRRLGRPDPRATALAGDDPARLRARAQRAGDRGRRCRGGPVRRRSRRGGGGAAAALGSARRGGPAVAAHGRGAARGRARSAPGRDAGHRAARRRRAAGTGALMRFPLALIAIAVVVAVASFVADHPGRVEIAWRDWQIETSVGVLAAAAVALGLAVAALVAVLRAVLAWPRRWRAFQRERRRRAGYAALTGGLVALAAGDGAAARAAWTAMLDRPATAVIGLRGLFAEAVQQGDHAAALGYAERARRLRASARWAVEGALALQLRAGRWEEARDSLTDAARLGIVPPERARHHRAVILVELAAAAAAQGDWRHAASLAARAQGLAPDLAPATC